MSTPGAPVPAPEGMSKSARKRANQKARAAAEAEEAAPPAPEPTPAPKAKSKAKAKAQPEPPAPEPAPKAKSKAKAKAKAEPEPPAPEPKAKAKGKAKAEPKAEAQPKAKGKAKAAPAPAPEPEPPAPEPKAKAKGKAKSKAAKPAPAPEPEPVREQAEELTNTFLDDGSGGAWEVSTGQDKKKARQANRRVEQQAAKHVIDHNIQAAAVPGMALAGADANGVTASQAVGAAKANVAKILAAKGTPAEAAVAETANVFTATITVPEKKIGIVIGPGGKKIKEIQEKTKTKINTEDTIFTISGDPDGVASAKSAIQQLVEKGYWSMSYDDFAENQVAVHPSCFPDIIGSGGKIIIKMKESLGVEINIPPVPKGSPPGKKFKITLAGSSEKVEQAKNVINDIVMYGHHDVTHPGLVHAELEVESWYYSFIIGKAGSELRHIQKNWNVKVSIPREHSTNQNVLIVGEPGPVEKAKTYIEKLLWNAENNMKSGRDRDGGGADANDWGDDGEEEEWMQAYLYKR